MDYLMRVLRARLDAAGRMQDFFGQDEFQQSGSPHTHSLLWTIDASAFKINTDAKICTYVNKFVTLSRSKIEDERVCLQTHHYSKSCKKIRGGRAICCFSFPWPPMRRTTIVRPLEEDIALADKAKSEALMKRVQETLEHFDAVKDRSILTKNSFDSFLKCVACTVSKYVQALCTTIVRPAIFLERFLDANMITPYNSFILRLWRANMDMSWCTCSMVCRLVREDATTILRVGSIA
jgi:hypothetical protein